MIHHLEEEFRRPIVIPEKSTIDLEDVRLNLLMDLEKTTVKFDVVIKDMRELNRECDEATMFVNSMIVSLNGAIDMPTFPAGKTSPAWAAAKVASDLSMKRLRLAALARTVASLEYTSKAVAKAVEGEDFNQLREQLHVALRQTMMFYSDSLEKLTSQAEQAISAKAAIATAFSLV